MREESPLATIVGARIAAKGWTLKQVADRAGLSVGAVWAIREGTRRRPHSFTLIKLAQGLEIPAEELFAAMDDTAARERALVRVYRHLTEENQRAVDALAVRLLAEQGPAEAIRLP